MYGGWIGVAWAFCLCFVCAKGVVEERRGDASLAGWLAGWLAVAAKVLFVLYVKSCGRR